MSANARGWHRLFYTAEDDLDLSWFLVVVFACAANVGLAADLIKSGIYSWHAWAFLGSTFFSVFLAAIPVAKSRVLARANVAGVAAAIAGNQPNMYLDNETGGSEYENMDRSGDEDVAQLQR